MLTAIFKKINKLKIFRRLNIIEYKLNQLNPQPVYQSLPSNNLDIDKLKIEIDYLKKTLAGSKNKTIKPNRSMSISYLNFEDKFRGSQKVIKNRQKKYIKYFLNQVNILDIGCGRGEFLQLLENENIKCLGIDNNSEMISLCQSKGLNVRQKALFDYLESIPDNFHGGMTAFQVIEHIDTEMIPNFVYLCLQKTKKGGTVIVETINPLCLQALANFWSDLTHQKPIVPLTLKHIFEEIGFSKVNIIGRTPTHLHAKDFKINPGDLTVYGDYAIIATK